jgi:hypothetical protein
MKLEAAWSSEVIELNIGRPHMGIIIEQAILEDLHERNLVDAADPNSSVAQVMLSIWECVRERYDTTIVTQAPSGACMFAIIEPHVFMALDAGGRFTARLILPEPPSAAGMCPLEHLYQFDVRDPNFTPEKLLWLVGQFAKFPKDPYRN